MDYYGVSLHKWLLAPMGTGLLYVRRDRIASTWPLQAAPATRDTDIRKFEEIGTHAVGPKAAINEAIAFQQAIGIERKAARLRYLTLRWANALQAPSRRSDPLEPGRGPDLGPGLRVDRRRRHEQAGRPPVGQAPHRHHRRSATTTPTTRRCSYRALRVTPNIYTPLEEIDTFVDAMRAVIKNGLSS